MKRNERALCLLNDSRNPAWYPLRRAAYFGDQWRKRCRRWVRSEDESLFEESKEHEAALISLEPDGKDNEDSASSSPPSAVAAAGVIVAEKDAAENERNRDSVSMGANRNLASLLAVTMRFLASPVG
jgi:hypothetical protein